MRIATGIPGAKRVQRMSLVAAIAVGALAFTGCGAINQQSTAIMYSASDGVHADMGKIELRNVLIISEKAGQPGRLTGTFYNKSDASIKLTVSGSEGSQTELTIPSGAAPLILGSKSEAAILSTVSAIPGAMEMVKLTQSDTSVAAQTLNVPVLDGTLPEYKDLVPTKAPSPSAEAPAPSAAPSAASAAASASESPSAAATDSATDPASSASSDEASAIATP